MDSSYSYCYDDLLINPCLSSIKSRSDIDLSVNIARFPRKLILKTPLISSCMNTITESQMAIDMAIQGGIGIIHRYMSIEKQVSEVKRVKRHLQYIIEDPYSIEIDIDIENENENENKYEKMDVYEDYAKKYGVKSFLIVDKQEKHLVGIITGKDYEMWKTMNSFHKPQSNLIIDVMTPIRCENVVKNKTYLLQHNCDDKSLDEILHMALDIMNTHNIEKVPIIRHDKKNGTYQVTGLITHKNIKHYLHNKSKASIDSHGRLLVGVAVGIKDGELQKVDQLVDAGADLICVDVANGFNTHVGEFIKQVRSKYPSLVIMAGNVCNASGFEYLNSLDVDCIRVGIGSGSICTTRLETGIGKGQWSAVNECFKYICQQDDNTDNVISINIIDNVININNINRNQHAKIISDGGSLGKTGNKAKALVTGASAVMLGQTLAGTDSSPGLTINRNGKKCKYFRGMASTMAHLDNQYSKKEDIDANFNAEGIDGFVEIKGTISDIIKQINGGIKSCFSYIGCNNINEVHDKRRDGNITFSIVTPIGMTETETRINHL